MSLPEELDALERAGIQDIKLECSLGTWYCQPTHALSVLVDLLGEGSTRTKAVRSLREQVEKWREGKRP